MSTFASPERPPGRRVVGTGSALLFGALILACASSIPGQSSVKTPAIRLDSLVTNARAFRPLRNVYVRDSRQLDRALATARFGDDIVLQAGVTYVGAFVLRNKTGSGWITIRSGSSAVPPAGTRVRPRDAAALPRLMAPEATTPVLVTEAGAHNYRLVGLELTALPGATFSYYLVGLGEGRETQNTAASMPRNLVLERLYVHGTSTLNFQRCISLQSAYTAILDSWISECHSQGFDSQAIAGWNGTGPYQIVNNYLEAAGENIMFGGADPGISGQLPADIEIRRNHFYKPPAWKGVWTVKNLFELKMGLRILIEDNVFENCWASAQTGFAIAFKSANQSGTAAWSETRDITFRYNIVRNSQNGLTLYGVEPGLPAVRMTRLYIGQNSFERIGNAGDYPGDGILWQAGNVGDLRMESNTGFGTRAGLQMFGATLTNLAVVNNVFGTLVEGYGWDMSVGSAEGKGWGTSALNGQASNWIFANNVLTKGPSAFPTANQYPASAAAFGFLSLPGNLELATSSPYRTAGTSGSVPGVDFVQLRARTRGVVVSP